MAEEQQSQMVFDSDEELNDALNKADPAFSGKALSSEARPQSRRGHPTSLLTVAPSPSGYRQRQELLINQPRNVK